MTIPNPIHPPHPAAPTQSSQPSSALPARASTLIIGGGPSGLVSLKYAREYGPRWAEGEGPVLVEMEGDVGGTFRWVRNERRVGDDGGLAGWTGPRRAWTGDGLKGGGDAGLELLRGKRGQVRIVICVTQCTARITIHVD